MLLKEIILNTPQENILYDDVLLQLAEENLQGEVIRFWESKQLFVVLGRICKEIEDLNISEIKENKILVLRRSSGGGTVLQGTGCFNYSLILSKDSNKSLNDIRGSYQFILNKVIDALAKVGVGAVFQPISDIALKEGLLKISGNAQRRGKKFILHHGTILYNFDLRKIAQYLAMPKDIPEYRQGRAHLNFVTNISVDVQQFQQSLKEIFKVNEAQQHLSDVENQYLKRFLKEKNVVVKI